MFIDLIIALLVTFIWVTLFSILFRFRGPWRRMGWFVLIIFLATWAGGIWLTPVGPSVGGYYLLPFLMSGLFVSLLLAAAATIPASGEETTVELIDRNAQRRREQAVGTALGTFFWVLLGLLLAAILFRYVM